MVKKKEKSQAGVGTDFHLNFLINIIMKFIYLIN